MAHSPGSCRRILVVDDEIVARKMLGRILRADGWRVTLAASGAEAIAVIASETFDVVLTDLVLEPGMDGLAVLRTAKQRDSAVEVVLMTGHATIDTAIEAMKLGAFHYLQKPLRPDEVRSLAGQAAEKRALGRRVAELERERDGCLEGVGSIVGTSPAIERVRQLIVQIRESDSNLVVTGESGTGKELVARAVHACSRRAGRRFQAFNCASFSDELLANELFGHEREAYTGASSTRIGLLESADGGTVFFDEVGDMSTAMQSKLLRVVQERELMRVGGTRPVPVDIRIVAATNKDLRKLVELGAFREDLYFRLNVINLHMPALAERREDVPLLAAHFLRQLRDRIGRPLEGFSAPALAVLASYGYPGNVRELENIVERGATLARGPLIEIDDLPPDLAAMSSRTFRYAAGAMRSLEELESDYIEWVLERVGNNKSRAAQVLGIDRVSLYRKLRKRQVTD